jgi:hypothetical protein
VLAAIHYLAHQHQRSTTLFLKKADKMMSTMMYSNGARIDHGMLRGDRKFLTCVQCDAEHMNTHRCNQPSARKLMARCQSRAIVTHGATCNKNMTGYLKSG